MILPIYGPCGLHERFFLRFRLMRTWFPTSVLLHLGCSAQILFASSCHTAWRSAASSLLVLVPLCLSMLCWKRLFLWNASTSSGLTALSSISSRQFALNTVNNTVMIPSRSNAARMDSKKSMWFIWKALWFEVGIPLGHIPVWMARHSPHHLNLAFLFKQDAEIVMHQIMEMEISNLWYLAWFTGRRWSILSHWQYAEFLEPVSVGKAYFLNLLYRIFQIYAWQYASFNWPYSIILWENQPVCSLRICFVKGSIETCEGCWMRPRNG